MIDEKAPIGVRCETGCGAEIYPPKAAAEALGIDEAVAHAGWLVLYAGDPPGPCGPLRSDTQHYCPACAPKAAELRP